jgi:hypothetical protein
MVHGLESFRVTDGERVTAEDARQVLSGAELLYDDGARQQFMPDGTTIYLESGSRSVGEWSVGDDGSFASYWPPSFRAEYSLTWRVNDGVAVGLAFESQRDHSVFSGLFQS